MLNLADPAAALRWWRLPADGVGLARMEFIVENHIKAHPMALAHFERVEDEDAREQIERLTRGLEDKTEFFVDTLARGIARIAASRYPNPVIVRMSDFKTNEYAKLVGGSGFEPARGEPDDRLAWREPLPQRGLPGRLSARVPGDPSGPRADRPRQRRS